MNDYQEAQADAQTNEGAQAPQQAQPSSGKSKAQDREGITAQVAIKRAVALEMLGDGASLAALSKALGYDRKSKTIQFLERQRIKVPARFRNEVAPKVADGETEADPATLTEAQLERAFILGLTPGRFAFLLATPHGLSPFSHPAPGNAYTRNII